MVTQGGFFRRRVTYIFTEIFRCCSISRLQTTASKVRRNPTDTLFAERFSSAGEARKTWEKEVQNANQRAQEVTPCRQRNQRSDRMPSTARRTGLYRWWAAVLD